jgi:hypothetical protein
MKWSLGNQVTPQQDRKETFDEKVGHWALSTSRHISLFFIKYFTLVSVQSVQQEAVSNYVE